MTNHGAWRGRARRYPVVRNRQDLTRSSWWLVVAAMFLIAVVRLTGVA